MTHQRTIPLFPLGVVLLPRMPLPLHIFEERYRVMLEDCLGSDRLFGIVYASGTKLQRTGCTARIDRVLKRYDDGRSDILTIGEERFRLVQVKEERPYLQADVEFFEDDNAGHADKLPELATEALDALEALSHATRAQVDISALRSLDPESVSFLVGSTGVFTLEERQSFLELTSSARRLEVLTSSLKQVTERRRVLQHLKEVLKTKGDLSYLFN
ncbi:MAG: LON peptidase substrate-binding domain-containing protein [bacterium]